MATRHVLVVGGGILGASCAYELAKRGERVTVIDRALHDGKEAASWGNAGLLSLGHAPLTKPGLAVQAIKWMLNSGSPLYIPPRFDPGLFAWLWSFHRHCNSSHLARCMQTLCAMGWLTIERIEEIVDQGTVRADCAYRRRGWLEVCLTPTRLEKAHRDAEVLREQGYAVEPLTGDELRRREPAYSDEVVGAMHHGDSACCDPAGLLRGAVLAAQRHGAVFRRGDVGELLRRDGVVMGVKLAGGEVLEADETVLAAGVWSTALARSAGVRCPMQAAKGYHRDLVGLPALPSMGGVMAETFVAVTPIGACNGGGERLRLAGTLELSGVNDRINARRVGMLQVGASRYLKGLEVGKVVGEWSGMRPCTADGMPILGRPRNVPRGLYLATGHAMMGMTLGPITGAFVAMALCGQPLPIDVSLMRADRF